MNSVDNTKIFRKMTHITLLSEDPQEESPQNSIASSHSQNHQTQIDLTTIKSYITNSSFEDYFQLSDPVITQNPHFSHDTNNIPTSDNSNIRKETIKYNIS